MDEKSLQGAEKVFYHDQKTAKICRLSEEIDEEWVNEQLAMLEQRQYQIQHQLQQQYEHEEMDSEDQNVESSMMDTSVNHSGLIRIMKEDAASQTENDFHVIPSPVRKLCGIDLQVKKACIKASVKCNMSTAMGLVAVQTVCEEMYDHHYYLSKGETLQNDPFLSQYREQEEEQNENMPCAKKMHWSNQKNKPPSSKEDYIPYQNVLPIAKTLNTNYCLWFRKRLRLQMFCLILLKVLNVHYIMTLHPDAKLMAIGQGSYSVFLITGDLFCTLYFMHLKTRHKLLNYLLRLTSIWPFLLRVITEVPQQRIYGRKHQL